jgi:hypothetical protein
MPQDIKNTIFKYKVVRRGPKYCVRVQGSVNTTESLAWCRARKMSHHVKHQWNSPYAGPEWDYDFIFDEKKEALTFILGYL